MSEKPIEQSKDFLKKYIWRLINFLIAGSALSSFVVFLLSHCDPTVLPAVVKLLDSLVASKLAIGFICSSSLLLFFVAIRNLLKPIIKPFCENYITQHELNAITKFIFLVLVGYIADKENLVADRDDTTPLSTPGNGDDLNQDASDPKGSGLTTEESSTGNRVGDTTPLSTPGDDNDLNHDASNQKVSGLATEKSSTGDRDDDTTPSPIPSDGDDSSYDASNQMGDGSDSNRIDDTTPLPTPSDGNDLNYDASNSKSDNLKASSSNRLTVFTSIEGPIFIPRGFFNTIGLTGETSDGDNVDVETPDDHNVTPVGDNADFDALYDAVGGLFVDM